ncbi:MAG: hypothetical protein ABL967_05155 [Bryobacteraceae bacterium]
MKLYNTVVLVALLGCATGSAFADSAFDGTWKAEVARPAPAPKQNLTITLNTDKGKVTGKMAIQGGGESAIEWGIVKGDLITFRVALPFNNTMVEFVHLGRLDGDKLMLGRRPVDLSQGVLVEYIAQKEK